MATTPTKRRKRYYDELAEKLPTFSPAHGTTSLSRRPMTVSIPKRGKVVSVTRKKAEPPTPVSRTQNEFDQKQQFRSTTPIRRAIHVVPIYPQTAKRDNTNGFHLDISPKPIGYDKVPELRSTNRQNQAISQSQTSLLGSATKDTNRSNNMNSLVFSSARSSSQTSFISSNNSPVSSERSSLSSSRSTSRGIELSSDIESQEEFKSPEVPPLVLSFILDGVQQIGSPPASLSPFTFCEEVIQLNEAEFDQFLDEDTLFVKSVLMGYRWTPESLYDFVVSLADEQYNIAMDIYIKQSMRIAKLVHLIFELVQYDDISKITQKLEKELQNIFNVPTCVVWINIPSAKTFINYTRLMKYPHGVGLVGTCGEEKREIMAPNPTRSAIYSEEFDLPFCEDAEVICCQPVIDPKTNEVLAVLLFIEKYHKSGAAYTYWPQCDLVLVHFFCNHLYRVFRRFQENDIYTSKMYKIMAKFMAKVHNMTRLIPLMNSTVQNLLNCDTLNIFLKEDDKFLTFRSSKSGLQLSAVSPDKMGIVSRVFRTNHITNVPIPSEDPDFSFVTDGQFKSGILAAPMIMDGKVIGVMAARGKKQIHSFTTSDMRNLSYISAFATPSIISSLNMRKKTMELRNALTAQGKLAALLQTAESFAKETNLDHLLIMIIENSKNLVSADRASLFVVDDSRTQLITKVADGIKPLLMPINQGIVGSVATTGQTINIPDAYEDSRFNSAIDKKTGYRTRSLVTIPVKDQLGQIIAVMQLMNKKNGKPFIASDVELCKAMCVFAGIALANSKIIEGAVNSTHRIEAMMDTVILLNNGESLSSVLHSILNILKGLIQADRSALFSIDKNTSLLSSTINQGEKSAIVLTYGKGVVGFIAETGKSVNIPDAYKDERFHSGTDQATGYRTRSILGAAVKDINGNVLAVIEMINKDMAVNGGVFTSADEQLLNAFASFAGFAYDKFQSRDEGNSVAIWFSNLLSSETLSSCEPPRPTMLPLDEVNLLVFERKMVFDLMRTVISIFYNLDLCHFFKIKNTKLVKFLLSVYDLHKNAKYFNFDRAVSSLQFAFYVVKNSELESFLTPIEKLALVISALCHNISHSEEVEGDQMAVALSVLFRNRPPYEIYHCEQTISCITKDDACIIEELTDTQANLFWQLFFDLVLSTDMAQHFNQLKSISCLVKPQNLFNQNVRAHRLMLMKLIMKAVDCADSLRGMESAKRWSMFVQSTINNPLTSEKDVAKFNVGFNLFISRPIISLLCDFLPSLKPILESVDSTTNEWKKLACQ